MEKRKTNDRVESSSAFGKKRTSKPTVAKKANSIPVPKGARKDRKRIGQGPGSGMGKTSTRGQKGQKARNTVRRGFEGGQMPIHRRLPKRGFTSIFHKFFEAVNLRDLQKAGLTGAVDSKKLVEVGILKDENSLFKILGTGEISSAIQITADRVSASALEKIQKAGGNVTLRERPKSPKVADKIKG